jgi:hypothetical protein
VQLWLGGKEGLENFSRPHAAWPTLFFSHPRRGTKPGHACKQPTSESASKQVTFFTDLSKALLLNLSLRWPPTSQFKECAKKGNQVSKRLFKLEGLWTIRVCRLVCFYFNIYSIYLNIECATVYAYLFCKKFFPYTRKLSFWKLLKTASV